MKRELCLLNLARYLPGGVAGELVLLEVLVRCTLDQKELGLTVSGKERLGTSLTVNWNLGTIGLVAYLLQSRHDREEQLRVSHNSDGICALGC